MIPNPNQLTAELRMMPDQQLIRFAQLHKADPYIFPMVVAEDTARKQMRAQAQAQGYRPQPTVADQALMGMRQQPAAGLTALPAQNIANMADGGIAGYDDGGVAMQPGATPSYQRTSMSPGMLDFAQRSEPVVRMAAGGTTLGLAGGTNQLSQYSNVIRNEAERLGIDPDMAMRLFMTESSGDPEAESPKGAVGLGQLREDAAREMGLDPKERKDPIKNIQASLRYFAKQQNKYGDPTVAAAAYNWGPGNVDKHLAQNQGRLSIPGLPKETAKYVTSLLPMGSAQAKEMPTQVAPAGEIPTGPQGMYPSVPRQETQEGFFGRLGTRMGMSEETKRNIENLNNALAGALGPAYIPSYVSKGPGVLRGLDALGSKIYGAISPQKGVLTAQEVAGLQRAAEAERAAQAGAQAAEAARMSGALPGEAQAAEQAAGAVRAAQVPSRAEEIQAASLAREAQTAGRIPAAARAAQTGTQATALSSILGGGAPTPAARPGEDYGHEGISYIPKEDKADIAKEIKADATPEVKAQAKKEGWTNDDWITLGFGLLASKSPYFTEALGTAGLGALKGKQERELMARQEAKEASEELYRERLGKKAEAEAGYLTEGTKGAGVALQQANAAYKNWESGLSALEKLNMTDTQRKAKYDEFLRQSFVALGLKLPTELSSAAPSAGKRLMFNPQTGKIE